jgi:hypothetical protein
MPPELPGGGVALEEDQAIASSRSRRFLNGLSIFQSKRFSSSSSAAAGEHRRGASLDSSAACLGGASGSFHWQYRFCEAQPPLCKQPSIRRKDDKLSRWSRIVGRFTGKNRVREETSSSCSQAKDQKPSPELPRRSARKYKWVSCEDLTRVNSRSGHDELVKPVLEPVQFATTGHAELVPTNAPRKPYQVATDTALEEFQTRKKPLFLPSRDEDARVMQECKTVVAHLRCKKGKEQGVVAAEARLLAKDCPTAREALATLGAIAPLVSMLDSTSRFCAHTALLALYTLAIGNDLNKATVVDAGAVSKMLDLMQSPEPAMQEAVVANLLSLSALDRNKPLIGASGAVSELVAILRRGGEQIQSEALRALYNLSLAQCNIKPLVEADATTVVIELLKTSRNAPATAEKALAVVGNMVAAPLGRKSITEASLETLIAALGFQFSKCQERAAYILMVMAHHSFGHRQAMVERRAIPALLEVSLLGSALTQKRAVRVLECLREDREQGRPMSAPLGPPRKAHSMPKEYDTQASEGSKIVNRMVQQSLEQNLQRIVRRANLPAPVNHMRAPSSLSGCSSSKSLPF